MADPVLVTRTVTPSPSSARGNRAAAPPRAPDCALVLFGASGDLTRRLLVPALYNLACDGLLPEHFAILGTAADELGTDAFRERLSADIRRFSTRSRFDEDAWADLVSRIHYLPGDFRDPAAFTRLRETLAGLDRDQHLGGNRLFYLATPPSVFGLISERLDASGLHADGAGFKRVVVEKPFGTDLASATALNGELLRYWREEEIYRIDHYLGKETVQNLLAFRFSNGMFEPVWNKSHVDHIQLTVSETVGVEGRGKYYDRLGVVRDMIQNHMFQMLAYLCMEPPISFRADAIRAEKAKVLEAIRVPTPDDVRRDAVRGQYGPGRRADGAPAPGYREEKDVDPESRTETFAALKLYVDNWRWDGVPIYLRSGKALWKRGTEIAVQFKKAPEVIFRDTPAIEHVESNQLLFHIQPDQGIELRFQAKTPGPAMALQNVNMRFDYRESFEAARGTGYEVLLYNCMLGDSTLFSRADMVESAWRVADAILAAWAAEPPLDFPNYAADSWGPRAAFELMARDGRKWVEIVNRETLEKVPLFRGLDPVFLHGLALMLKPQAVAASEHIVRKGETGDRMYVVVRGAVEVLAGDGRVLSTLEEGNFFGETALVLSQTRTASVRARTDCDLLFLERSDLNRMLREHPQFASTILGVARERYQLTVADETAFDPQVRRLIAEPGPEPHAPVG